MFDLIGDIHGHAQELTQLLNVLGYRKERGIYAHPERKVIFLGDFIDRGPNILEVLEIVRGMIEAGSALGVMGNHELNALAYYTADAEVPGQFLRRHNPVNERQHYQTLRQLQPQDLRFYLDWFRTLPLWLELDGLRAVHACWDERSILQIQQGLEFHQGVTDSFLQSACRPHHPLFKPVETILKGKEAALPEGISIADKDGYLRTRTRVRWYQAPAGHNYRTYALTDHVPCELDLDDLVIQAAVPYPAGAKPVFVGHYWLTGECPAVLANNVACLDYSVARGGFLCCYRWQGEQTLDNSHFVRAGNTLQVDAVSD